MVKKECFGKYSEIDVYCKECDEALECCKETDGMDVYLNKICIGSEITKIDVVEPGEIRSMVKNLELYGITNNNLFKQWNKI